MRKPFRKETRSSYRPTDWLLQNKTEIGEEMIGEIIR